MKPISIIEKYFDNFENYDFYYRKRLNSIAGTKVELSFSTHALVPIFPM